MAEIAESGEKMRIGLSKKPSRLGSIMRGLDDGLGAPPSPKFSYSAQLSHKVSCPRRVVAFTDKLGNISAGLQAPVTEEDYTPTADLIMPENSIFGRELRQHFDAVLNQSLNGVSVTNIMMDFFNEQNKHYRAFTTAMAKNAQAQLTKLKKIPNNGDRMDVSFAKCCTFLEHSSQLAQKYSEHNQKYYNQIVKPFNKFQIVHTSEAKEVSRRAAVLKAGLVEQETLVKKEKKSYCIILENASREKARNIEHETVQEKQVKSRRNRPY